MQIDPNSDFRVIVAGPDYACHKYNYYGEKGYKVTIGRSAYIEIPLTMLQIVFEEAKANKDLYNHSVFSKHYELQKRHHPCHVHVVGNLFIVACVAERLNNRDYKIL